MAIADLNLNEEQLKALADDVELLKLIKLFVKDRENINLFINCLFLNAAHKELGEAKEELERKKRGNDLLVEKLTDVTRQKMQLIKDLEEARNDKKLFSKGFEQLQNITIDLKQKNDEKDKVITEAKNYIKDLCNLVDFLNEDNTKEPLVEKALNFIKGGNDENKTSKRKHG